MIQQFLNKYLKDVWAWKQLVLTFILLSLVYFWYSGMMLHHIWDSPFNYKGADFTYWLFHWLRLDQIPSSGYGVSLFFSIVLLLSFILAIVKIKNRYATIAAGILLLIYQVLFNGKLGYHTHHLFGFQFALLPFYYKEDLFKASLGLARVLCCLAYFFAGFFKLYQGAWLSLDSFSHVLSNQHAAYIFFQPEGIRTSIVVYLIGHPVLGYLFFLSAMFLQLFFIFGLFTNRFNFLLAIFILLFHVMDWFLMNLGVFMGMTLMMWLMLYKENKA